MPLMTLIPLIISAIKIAYEIVEWLRAHPEIAAEAKRDLGILSAHLDVAGSQATLINGTDYKPNDIQSP